MLLLRSHIVRYYRAAASISASESPLPFTRLNALLLQLNLELKEQLFGNSASVAKCEAFETSAVRGRVADLEAPSASGGMVLAPRARTPVAALRMLRSSLQLGRRKRARSDAVATPQKRTRQSGVAVLEQVSTPQAASELAPHADGETPKKLPAPADHLAEVEEGLKQTVQDLADRHWNSLPDEGDPHVEVQDAREEELRLFTFAAFPLRRFAKSAVLKAEKSVQRKLTINLAAVLKASWEQQRDAMEKEFSTQFQSQAWNRQQTTEAIENMLSEFAEVVDTIGRGGWQKRKLLKALSQYLPPDPATPGLHEFM